MEADPERRVAGDGDAGEDAEARSGADYGVAEVVDGGPSDSDGEGGEEGELQVSDEVEDERVMEELDLFAAEWIGSDLNRWYWYEGMKAKRRQLQQVYESNDEELQGEIDEVRAGLRELDEAVNVGLVDQSGKITPAGWTALVLSLALNIGGIIVLVKSVEFAWRAINLFVHPVTEFF
jgi:hypothetical protein